MAKGLAQLIVSILVFAAPAEAAEGVVFGEVTLASGTTSSGDLAAYARGSLDASAQAGGNIVLVSAVTETRTSTQGAIDAHVLDFTWLHGPPRLGVWSTLTAGAQQGLVEGAARLAWSPSSRLRVGVGPIGRRIAGRGLMGASLQGQWQEPISLRSGLRATTELVSWPASGAPDATVQLSLAARTALSPRVELTASLSARYQTPVKEDVEPGFTESSLTAGRTGLHLRWWAHPLVGLGLDASAYAAHTDEVVRGGELTFTVSTRVIRTFAPAVQPFEGFRWFAPDAQSVAVVGSFSDWQPVPMRREADGAWSLPLALAPGRYEFVYLVDGAVVAPPGLPRQSDGFGGENAILEVR